MAKKPTMDGFIPRRSASNIGGSFRDGVEVKNDTSPYGLKRREITAAPESHAGQGTHGVLQTDHGLTRQDSGLRRSDIDDSLKSIDTDAPVPQKTHRRGRLFAKRKKLLWMAVLLVVVIGIGITGWIGIRTIMAGSSVFNGDIFDIIQAKKLKADTYGRTNVLIFGTSEDDEGGEHPGAFLTDSIMVLSVNQDKKDAFMVSIPRDLWVKYGAACNSGYEGKINELFGCYSDNGDDQRAGEVALSKKVAEVTGLDIQYQVHVNYTVVRQAVDAVGGVDVKIESSDPNGILDRNFDWKCNYKCYYVKYKNGEVAHMDGEHALAFMRARNAQGGYGLPNGNFDREKNQQKVMVALREKALSAGTLTNPAKITGLIDALGNNLNTNFETSEVSTLLTLATNVQTGSITSINLVDDKDPMMTTGNIRGISIVRPVAGIADYTDIASYIRKQINADAATKENASIVVLNGSGVVGAAQIAGDKLAGMGFTIDGVDNAPAGNYPRRALYARDATSAPATRAKLTALYGKPTLGLAQFGVADDVQFVVVVGQADSSNE